MAESTWTTADDTLIEKPATNRWKYVAGGVVILAAIAFLIVNAMSGTTQLYKTVDEFYAEESRLTGRDLRVSGWVIGDSIQYTQIDDQTSMLEFDIVDNINNPGQRLHIVAMNEPVPDLLQHEAQALVEGSSTESGIFNANPGGLLLKCPTRYEELDPSGHPGDV
jgi:cytochrome c-type biogenesis protein CcmE